MKTTMKYFALIACVALVAAACGGPQNCQSNCPRPVWADSPPALGAIGIAKGTNTGMARKMALDKGRQEIARQISVKVMGLLEQSAQQVVGANPGEITGHEYAEEITRTLHKQFLSGSKAVHYWQDCCTGEWYVLVTVEKEGLLMAANQAAQAAAKKILKMAEGKHEELAKKLDENIDKEFGE